VNDQRPSGPITADVMSSRLARWAEREHPGSSIAGVAPMPGNAGLSFGFDLVGVRGDSLPLVVRLAPPGVPRRGNTDVLRQVRLLDELTDSVSFPTAPVHWAAADDPVFGSDAFMVGMLRGKPLHMTSDHLSCEVGPAGIGPLLDLAVDALIELHELPVSSRLAAWDTPASPEDDLNSAVSLVGRTRDDWLGEHGIRLAEQLRTRIPASSATGLRHGDFQTNNLLFEDGALTGVVDWELTGLGAQLSDLTWLIMMTDRTCWNEEYGRRLRVTTDPGRLIERYRTSGRHLDALPWHLALTCLRFSAIVCYNLRLHLEGKRVDPYFVELRHSVPRLIDRGQEALSRKEI
jgi:aminoglycoside phosphotransferase (APT) family kinase protein